MASRRHHISPPSKRRDWLETAEEELSHGRGGKRLETQYIEERRRDFENDWVDYIDEWDIDGSEN